MNPTLLIFTGMAEGSITMSLSYITDVITSFSKNNWANRCPLKSTHGGNKINDNLIYINVLDFNTMQWYSLGVLLYDMYGCKCMQSITVEWKPVISPEEETIKDNYQLISRT